MNRTMLRAKIHRVAVTQCDVAYEGSLTLDPELMDAHFYRAIPVVFGHDIEPMIGIDLPDGWLSSANTFSEARPFIDILIEDDPDNGLNL